MIFYFRLINKLILIFGKVIFINFFIFFKDFTRKRGIDLIYFYFSYLISGINKRKWIFTERCTRRGREASL